MAAAGFHSRYLNGPLPYVQRHITINKNVLSALLNKYSTIKPDSIDLIDSVSSQMFYSS